jgi:adenylate kinase
VSDELIAELIEKRIKEIKEKGFILDGYPRTLKQAELLEKIMKKFKQKINAVVNFTISEKTTLDRLGGRLTCKNCNKVYHVKYLRPKIEGKCDACGKRELITRDDDKPEAIKKRLEAYKKQTKPLIEYYKKKGLLKEIDGQPSIEKIKPVFDELIKEIKG